MRRQLTNCPSASKRRAPLNPPPERHHRNDERNCRARRRRRHARSVPAGAAAPLDGRRDAQRPPRAALQHSLEAGRPAGSNQHGSEAILREAGRRDRGDPLQGPNWGSTRSRRYSASSRSTECRRSKRGRWSDCSRRRASGSAPSASPTKWSRSGAGEPDSPKVYGTDPEVPEHYGKRINPDSESTWTIARAKQAGYVPTPKVENPNPNNDGDWLSVEKIWDGAGSCVPLAT